MSDLTDPSSLDPDRVAYDGLVEEIATQINLENGLAEILVRSGPDPDQRIYQGLVEEIALQVHLEEGLVEITGESDFDLDRVAYKGLVGEVAAHIDVERSLAEIVGETGIRHDAPITAAPLGERGGKESQVTEQRVGERRTGESVVAVRDQRTITRRSSSLLVRLGGGQEDILHKAAGDRPRYVVLGGLMVSIAVIAAISVAFALATALNVPTWLAALFGTLWGLLILTLDRGIVASTGRRNRLWRNLLSVLPRLALAALSAAVISVPLLLVIFQSEINSEVTVIQTERQQALDAELDRRFAGIVVLERRIDELTLVSDDPEVRRLQAQVDARDQDYRAAQAAVVCETDGTCGSGQAGAGPAYQAKVATRDQMAGELASSRARLEAATDAASARITAARPELTRAQAELEQLRGERQVAEDAGEAAVRSDDLAVRVGALERITGEHTNLWLLAWSVFLLLTTTSMLPVVAKLLSNLGAPTLHDRLLERRNDDVLNSGAAQLRGEIAATQAEVQLRLEKDLAAAQLEAARHANAALVEAQIEVAERAIDIWKESALTRSDDELIRWYQDHYSGGPDLVSLSPESSPSDDIGKSHVAASESHSGLEPGPGAQRRIGNVAMTALPVAPLGAQHSSFQPILSERNLRRIDALFSGPRPRARVALVLVTKKGEHRAFLPDRLPTLGELLHSGRGTLYEVDIGLHHVQLEFDVPTRASSVTARAIVDVEWRVVDPERVVKDGLVDVGQALVPALQDRLGEITRQFDVEDLPGAEVAAQDELDGLSVGADRGLVTRIFLRLQVNELIRIKASAHRDIAAQLDVDAQRLLIGMEQRMEQLKQELLLGVRVNSYQLSIESGDLERFSRQLAQNPDDVNAIVEMVNRQHGENRRVASEFISRLVESGAVERWVDVDDQVRSALEWLKESNQRVVDLEDDPRRSSDENWALPRGDLPPPASPPGGEKSSDA